MDTDRGLFKIVSLLKQTKRSILHFRNSRVDTGLEFETEERREVGEGGSQQLLDWSGHCPGEGGGEVVRSRR